MGLSAEAKAVITQIRTSPPARHVQSGAGNVSGTYPSIKMGCAIQFESHRNELPFVYLMDHDPQVLEFYDQPYGQLKLKYRNQDDTHNVTATHTPDFFVLREDGAGWVECKMEEDLPSNSHHLEIGACTAEVVSWYVDEVCFKIVRGLRYLCSFKRDRSNIPWLSSRHSSGIRC